MKLLEELSQRENIIVCDRAYFPLMFIWKNKHPDLNIKFVTKNEVIGILGGKLNDEAIKLMIHELKMQYLNAKRYKKIIEVVGEDITKLDNPTAKAVFKLVKDKYEIDPYGVVSFKDKNIYLLEMDDEKTLVNLFNKHGLKYKNISLSDEMFNLKSNKPGYVEFDDKFSQYLYIFSDIRKRIVEDKTKQVINQIEILIKDKYDLFYVNLFASIFKIKVFNKLDLLYFDNPSVKDLLSIFNKKTSKGLSKDMNLKDKYGKTYDNIFEFIKKYDLDKLDYKDGYNNLLEIVSSKTYKMDGDDSGIVVTSQVSLNPKKIYYVTNFDSDSFYKISKNDNVLSDLEFEALNINASYHDTSLDKQLKWNFIQYNDILLLSRVKQHLDDHLYESPFVELYSLKKDKVDAKLGVYTTEANNLYHIDQLDRAFFRKQIDILNSYDHKFKGLKVSSSSKDDSEPKSGSEINTKEQKRATYGVTELDRFAECPFKYYLEKLLPEDTSEKYKMHIGTLLHAVYENIHFDEKDFNFENAWKNGVSQFYKQAKHTEKTDVILEILKYWYLKIIKCLHNKYQELRNKGTLVADKTLSEKKLSYDINSCNATIKGKVDKVLVTKDEDGKEYYTIVDFKSGFSDFNAWQVCTGKSLQLPLYYVLLSNALANNDDFKDLKECTFGGFGIQHILSNSIKNLVVDDDISSLKTLISRFRINGLFKDDDKYHHSIEVDDASYTEGNKLRASGTKFINVKNAFTKEDADECIIKGKKYSYNLNNLIDDAKKITEKIIKLIQNKSFHIWPTSLEPHKTIGEDTEFVCKYCPYKDICYHKDEDNRDCYVEIQTHFQQFAKGKEAK